MPSETDLEPAASKDETAEVGALSSFEDVVAGDAPLPLVAAVEQDAEAVTA